MKHRFEVTLTNPMKLFVKVIDMPGVNKEFENAFIDFPNTKGPQTLYEQGYEACVDALVYTCYIDLSETRCKNPFYDHLIEHGFSEV